MNSYKILYYVPSDSSDPLNGKIIDMPIIPRVGDYVDLSYVIDSQNGNNSSCAVIGEVTTVYIHNSAKKNVDAQVHLKLDTSDI